MKYISTRGGVPAVTAAEAIMQGLAPDGGLFVPEALPRLAPALWMEPKPYAVLAAEVLRLFFGELPDLEGLTAGAYKSFSAPDTAPVVPESDGTVTLELFHGPTAAFKDMALQVLPGLLNRARLQTGETRKTCILTATSGDTGKAALEGFSGQPDAFVLVFYPENGVSDIQRLQMTTQTGGNVGVCAVRGNFDDAQSGVKTLFASKAFAGEMDRRGWRLSSANSINIGRLIPQAAYYVFSYGALLRQKAVQPGETVNFCVPTGNFGNILAGLYAKEMGLPIGRLICASNRNRVLTDALNTGRYSLKREFYTTSSPSMDILISSNFERAVHLLSGGGGSLAAELMSKLKTGGEFTLPAGVMNRAAEHFAAYSCNEEDTLAEIRQSFEETGKVFDPHTAVARRCLREHRAVTGDTAVTVIAATASPYKFPETVLTALGRPGPEGVSAMRALEALSGTPVPEALEGVLSRPVRFTDTASPDALDAAALRLMDAVLRHV